MNSIKKNVVILKNPSTKDTWKVNIESIVFFIFQSSFICVRKYGPFVEVRKKSKVKYFEYFKALFVLSVTAVEPLSFSGNSFMILEIYRGCLISRSLLCLLIIPVMRWSIFNFQLWKLISMISNEHLRTTEVIYFSTPIVRCLK